MTKTAIAFVGNTLSDAGINYDYVTFNRDIVYPYWVGEYRDSGAQNEDGMISVNFTLNGWTRGEWIDLENDKEIIETIFSDCTSILSNGSGIVVTYDGAQIIPTGDAELKRMRIDLKVNEWKVNV